MIEFISRFSSRVGSEVKLGDYTFRVPPRYTPYPGLGGIAGYGYPAPSGSAALALSAEPGPESTCLIRAALLLSEFGTVYTDATPPDLDASSFLLTPAYRARLGTIKLDQSVIGAAALWSSDAYKHGTTCYFVPADYSPRVADRVASWFTGFAKSADPSARLSVRFPFPGNYDLVWAPPLREVASAWLAEEAIEGLMAPGNRAEHGDSILDALGIALSALYVTHPNDAAAQHHAYVQAQLARGRTLEAPHHAAITELVSGHKADPRPLLTRQAALSVLVSRFIKIGLPAFAKASLRDLRTLIRPVAADATVSYEPNEGK